jgi:uncharacterized GH25 family protein
MPEHRFGSKPIMRGFWRAIADNQKNRRRDHPYKIEKFSNALVNVTPADNGFSTVIGDILEIVPVTNPATVRPGDEMTVKVLFKGQPLVATSMRSNICRPSPAGGSMTSRRNAPSGADTSG